MKSSANIKTKLTSIGPGMLVTSAFIGPGTVTMCSIAGYQYGFGLLWALLFSIIATIVIQEMCGRIGLITQMGVAELLTKELKAKKLKIVGSILIVSAVVIGNSAYEAGNITGASLGMNLALNDILAQNSTSSTWLPILIIGLSAMALIATGSYKIIEKTLIVLVAMMSVVFVFTAIASGPNVLKLLQGLFLPQFQDGSLLTIVGLIGTTIVPYNIFLHSAAISAKWKSPDDLKSIRFDTIFSIALGGVVSISIVICSAAVAGLNSGTNLSIIHLADMLSPILGSWSKYFMGIGLFAAGLSSAITAPLAAAYTAAGVFGYQAVPSNRFFKITALGILVFGICMSLVGFKPLQLIHFAQLANGILLPIVAIMLIWVMNNKQLLGNYTNSRFNNTLAFFVVVVTLLLAIKTIFTI